FYDSDNTAYYFDGSSTSVLNALTVNGGAVYRSDWTTRFQSSSNFVNGTLVSTDIPATASNGDSFVIEITGKSYSASNPPFKAVAQGYLYNNTIIAFSGINYGGEFSSYIRVFEDGGVLKFWWPSISYWNSFNVNVMTMNDPTDGTITRNRVTSITNSTEPTGSKKQTINLAGFMRSDISATNSVDLRAPRFYDSDNTAYYVDPASTSNVNAMVSYSYQGNGNVGGTGSASWHPSGIYSAGHNWLYGGISAGGGDINSVNSVYANIYYDSGNTAYYVDPASTSNLNGLNVGGSAAITVDNLDDNNRTYSGHFYLQPYYGSGYYMHIYPSGGAGATSTELNIRTWNGSSYTTANFITSGYSTAAGSYRAPLFYDSDNTAYYVDPASESVLNTVTFFGELNLSATGQTYVDHTGTIIFRNQSGYATSATLTTSGNFTATGNVTAYSDIRVKDNVKQIEGALDKVQAIRGVTYNRTDLEDTERRYGGVIAQEIEKVLPEAIFESNDRKAVDYNATIGLLIEAIKELKAEVETLKKG
ncbi:hypothetical protein SXAG_00166, partial [Synechococcus phage S-CBS4]